MAQGAGKVGRREGEERCLHGYCGDGHQCFGAEETEEVGVRGKKT